jgi:hypothetical protein
VRGERTVFRSAPGALIEPTFGEGEIRDTEIFLTASENLRHV